MTRPQILNWIERKEFIQNPIEYYLQKVSTDTLLKQMTIVICTTHP